MRTPDAQDSRIEAGETAMPFLSRNAQVLKYFAQQCPAVGRTKLLKLAYLADLESRQLLGHPVSSFDYIWYDHGPFDTALYSAIEELKAHGMADEEEVVVGLGYIEQRLVDTGQPAMFDFSPAESEILYYVATKYQRTALRELLSEVVYETGPMKAVQRKGERLPMETLDGNQRDRIGFDLEDIIAAEQEIDAGHFRPADEFFDELRSKTVRDGSELDH